MITSESIHSYVDLSFNVSIAFMGIGFTIFTLLYAFIQNKKDALKEIEDTLNIEGGSISLYRKRNSAVKFINKMREINVYAIIIILSSLFCVIATGTLKLKKVEFPCIWKYIVMTTLACYIIVIALSMLGAFLKIMRAYDKIK